MIKKRGSPAAAQFVVAIPTAGYVIIIVTQMYIPYYLFMDL